MKKPEIKPELIKAAETLLLAMAAVQTLEPVITDIKKGILAKHQFIIPKNTQKRCPESLLGKPVLDPEQTYLLSGKDFNTYVRELDNAYKENGYDVAPGFCPLLIAQHLEIQARIELLKAGQYLTGVDPETIYRLDARKKMADLMLQMCAPLVDKELAEKIVK